ncbi:MAG TPA: TldD/PmbA family protein [Firmicutes bacterium]|nr:TldD/PmbA family protein [Candidatus Fermentithermobacillaceae bacterium]
MVRFDLREYASLFSAYTELRVQENRNVSVVFVKGNNTTNARSAISGVSARVYKGGSWGFSSSPELTPEAIKSVVKAATDNAAFLDLREKKGKPPLPAKNAVSENDFSTKKPKLTQKQLVEYMKELDGYIARTYPNLTSRTVVLNSLEMEKTLLTSDGSSSHSMIPRTIVAVVMSMERDGKPVELSKTYGGLGQPEDVLGSPLDLSDLIEEQYQHLVRKSEGVFANAGLRTCVLDADLAGILAHEAIGHTIEADLVMAGSVASGWIGKEVASPLITLVDFANTFDGAPCPVPVYIDDEGTKAEDAVVIDGGVLKTFLHNRESAGHFGVQPTGNARAYLFSDEPLIRMRNTAFLPGKSKLQEMIESVEDGYYLMRPSNGQADSTSEFMFGITLGYEIKNGKLGKAIRDTTISGIAFDVLKTVTMVSDDMKWSCSGMCGKKQMIPVGMGGPAIKCKVNIGGR